MDILTYKIIIHKIMEPSEETNISSLSRDILDTISHKLTSEELINWCQVNKRFAKLCSSEEWVKRTKRDFGQESYIQIYKSEIRNYKAAQVRDIIKEQRKIMKKNKKKYEEIIEGPLNKAFYISEELAKHLRKVAPEDFQLILYKFTHDEFRDFLSDKILPKNLKPKFKRGRIIIFDMGNGPSATLFQNYSHGDSLNLRIQDNIDINFEEDFNYGYYHEMGSRTIMARMPPSFYKFIEEFGIVPKAASILYNTDILFPSYVFLEGPPYL